MLTQKMETATTLTTPKKPVKSVAFDPAPRLVKIWGA
jgi:hypothetical protein